MAKKITARKSRTTVVEETGETVADEVVVEKPPRPAAGIETWLIFVTLAALIAAFVMINLKMRADFGEGWPI